jgi:RNA polymerase sigma-70 factor (ECF subfamily)
MHRVKSRTKRALVSFEGLLAPLREQAPEAGAEIEEAEELGRIRGAVREVLAKINPRYRRAIELRFLEERGREECAEAMEVKLGTFDVVLLRALRSFRKEWARSIGEEGRA